MKHTSVTFDNNIFNTDNKEKTFCEAKNVCLTMIKNQKEQTNDEEISDITKIHVTEDKNYSNTIINIEFFYEG